MNREIISNKQGIILLMLFIFGSTLVIGSGGQGKKDMWLSIIMAIIFALPVLLMYAKLLSMFPQKDIFDILKLVLGNFIGKTISLLFIWYALHLGALVLFNFSDFVSTVGLDQTPRVVFVSVFVFLCIWGVKEGVEVLGRWSEILIPFLLLIIFLSVILSIPNLKLSNILPVLENGMKPVMKGAFSAFSFPFAETVIFMMVFSCLKEKKSSFKIYIVGLLLAGSILAIISIRNIMVLGTSTLARTLYPGYLAVGRINIGNFLQRLESAVSITFLIAGFIKISICLLAASKGISKLFNFTDYRFIVIPTALIILNLQFLVANDELDLKEWVADAYSYYVFIFQVILPVLIFVCAKIRYKKICNESLDNV